MISSEFFNLKTIFKKLVIWSCVNGAVKLLKGTLTDI